MISRDEADTAEYFYPFLDQAASPQVAPSLVKAEIAALSHQGKVRTSNEDHFLVGRTERTLQTLLTNLPDEMVPAHFGEAAYGMLVADGMGGREAGEVASRLAISTFIQLVLATPDWIMRLDARQAERWMQRMAERFRQVHEAVSEKSRHNPALSGMGTTLTVACSIGEEMIIAHVGDSRVYLFRQGQLQQLTHDHTMAQKLADMGVITPEKVATHQYHHVLTDAIGSTGRGEAEVQLVKLMDGDGILLCTDGLTEMVTNAAIAETLARIEPPAEACQALIDQALAGGGRDNVTIVLARYHIPEVS